MRVQIRHFVQGHAHVGRLRTRRRRLAPVRPSRANELWYKAALLGLVKHVRGLVTAHVVPAIHAAMPTTTGDRMAVGDALSPHAVDTVLHRIAQQMGGLKPYAEKLAAQAVQKNLHAVDTRLIGAIQTSVGVNLTGALTRDFAIQSAMQRAVLANVDLITSIPQQYLDQVRGVILDGFTSGTRWEDLADAIEQRGDVTESRAKLIARDQTSKMNSAFNEIRQTSLGIDSYTWQTSGDERVREEHAANDGKTFQWDDPPETGHPGEDINCRCAAVPNFDLDALEKEQKEQESVA